ncbi:MAG: molybdenum cofactor guanylyltransferase [Coriobacteriales bacterium]|nr:molybdenum cofactor guanylyltransferase [Coriobacteriales bacterium]
MTEYESLEQLRASFQGRIDDLTVVIQAGGESKRMGRSKATVPFLGEPMIWRLVRRLSPVAGEMVITTNEPQNLSFLADEYGRPDIVLAPDLIDRRGALTGVYTALKTATKPYVAIVACDMIFASPYLIASEYDIATSEGVDAVVPRLSHGYEPFHALYDRDKCLAFVNEALAAGDSRAQGWFEKANLHLMTAAEVLRADPRGGCFINVNTPGELAAMEERIRREGMSYAQEDWD